MRWMLRVRIDSERGVDILEKDIASAIKTYLRSLGADVFFWKEHGGPYGTSGVPDIICCYKGHFLGLEVKRPGGRLSDLQKRTLRKINDAGGVACKVESVEDVKGLIRRIDESALAKASRPPVYVCSPYRGDIPANTERAKSYCRFAVTKGCIPIAPHLLFTQFLDDSVATEREQGLRMGAELLKLCDELWAFGTPSAGMRAEMDTAKQLGKPIRSFDIPVEV